MKFSALTGYIIGGILSVTPFYTYAAEGGGFAIGVMGAATIQNPSLVRSGTATTVDGEIGFGGGLSGEFVFTPNVGLELDLIYLNHKFSQITPVFFGTNVNTTYTSGYLHFPLLLRYRLFSVINLGAGIYYNRVVTSWTLSAPGFSNTSADYGKDDFGFVLALGGLVPLSQNLSITGDLRYARSLTETARSTIDVLQFSDFQIFLGLRFGLR